MRANVALLFVIGILCGAARPLSANPLEEQLEPARVECASRMADLRRNTERWRWIEAGLAAVGGLAASLGGLTASRSHASQTRKRWGYLAAVGGVAAAVSPFLPRETSTGPPC